MLISWTSLQPGSRPSRSVIISYNSRRLRSGCSACLCGRLLAPIYGKQFPNYYLPVRYFQQMSPATRKTISNVCLVFAILWFVWIGLLEVRYVRSVLRDQTGLHEILGT